MRPTGIRRPVARRCMACFMLFVSSFCSPFASVIQYYARARAKKFTSPHDLCANGRLSTRSG